MFGKDRFTLSKPNEVKANASLFSANIRKIDRFVRSEEKQNSFNPDLDSFLKGEKNSHPKKEPKGSPAKNKKIEDLKLDQVKPFAKEFVEKFGKLESLPTEKNKEKLIYSYSDRGGSSGKIDFNGENIRIRLAKIANGKFYEEKILIYLLPAEDLSPLDSVVNVKGWGNTKEQALLNALKNSAERLLQKGLIFSKKELLITRYSVVSMISLADGGWECKVNITPGELNDDFF